MSFFQGGWIDQMKTMYRGRPVVVTTLMEQGEGVYALELEFTDGSTLRLKWDAAEGVVGEARTASDAGAAFRPILEELRSQATAERRNVGSSFAVLQDGNEWTPLNPDWVSRR